MIKSLKTHARTIFLVVVALVAGTSAIKADIWGELGKGLLKGLQQTNAAVEQATVEKYINTPAAHSADMKKYLNYINNGNEAYQQGKYATAWNNYFSAQRIGLNTTDHYLKLLHNKYGWSKEIGQMLVATQGMGDDGSTISTGYTDSYSGGGSSTTSTSSSSTGRVCSLCKGTGLKIAEHYSAGQTKWCSTCNKTVGTGHQHVRCDLCKGTGHLDY